MKKILFVFTCLLISSVYGFSIDGKNEKNVIPGVAFDKLSFDYGNIPYDGDGITTFTLTNNSKEPLIIKDCRASCGCTIPKWVKEPIKPGASTKIEVGYNTRLSGPFSKSITVITNFGQVTLGIKGEVAEKSK